MAYNYRPKSASEIIKKKKTYSVEAASIYEYVNKNYGETIVLDPKTDFKKVKIPRAVEKEIGIAELKRKLKENAPIDKVDISFGNGSGKGGSSINAVETAKQENATRFVCQEVIEHNKFPSGADITKIYPDYDDDWHETFKMQSESLKKWLGPTNRGYEYSRDAQNGMMAIIESTALNKCGVKTKDSWNPADIYICKKSKKQEIKKEIERIGSLNTTDKKIKLDMLNEYMRKKFKTRELVGISLKKLGKTVSLEETNVDRLQTLKDIEIIRNSIRLNLDLNDRGEFTTGEMALKIQVGSDEVNIQIRAFSGGVRESTQMDMTGAGAAAKLGKVSSREAIEPFLRDFPNLKRRMGTDLPKVGQWTAQDIKKYIDEKSALERLTIDGSRVDFGDGDWSKTLNEAIQLEKENNRTASQLSAKLQCFRWVEIFAEIDQKGKLKDFLSVLYSGAKKQYASAGPFLKIS